MLKYSEEKILLVFSEEPSGYLSHLATKAEAPDSQLLLQEIIGLTNDLFLDRIERGSQQLSEKPNLKELNASLAGKITDMKRSIMSLSSIDRKASKEFENFMEFRKKSYWNVPSEKNEQLKAFLTKMKRVCSEHKRNYRKAYRDLDVRTQREA
jgi:hypothetical protein